MSGTSDPRRAIPAVETILRHPAIAEWGGRVAPEFVASVIRVVVATERDAVSRGRTPLESEALVQLCVDRLSELIRPTLKRVINATGVILHTGLGRAPMSSAAEAAIAEAVGYTSLEFDLESGGRGDRQMHVEPLICLLTGAEAALVVNNNAAALYLVLNALGYRREVIVSRGQLIEIGGSFRLPDIMERTGAKLVEVGTTNRTRTTDYQVAITDKTAVLLRAHTSNYRIEGFTESVSIEDLVTIGRSKGIPVVDDLGSGVLWDWTGHGLPYEPSVADSLKAGSDLVLVSGDKALGGPQAGIILGRRDLVARLKKTPLARVLRPDKLILAALSATLRQFLTPDAATASVPVWQMLTVEPETLRRRAEQLRSRLAGVGAWATLEVRPTQAEAGSGTMPAMTIPSFAVCGLPAGNTASRWARRLRMAQIPVVATVRQDLVWLDLRTISERDESDLVASVALSLQKG